jgi:hypothetical protein
MMLQRPKLDEIFIYGSDVTGGGTHLEGSWVAGLTRARHATVADLSRSSTVSGEVPRVRSGRSRLKWVRRDVLEPDTGSPWSKMPSSDSVASVVASYGLNVCD